MIPPPTEATWGDVYRFGLGLLMIPLGITILARTFAAGIFTPPAILLGLAFVAFGIYRVYVGVVRYRMYKRGASNALAPALTTPKGGCALPKGGYHHGRFAASCRALRRAPVQVQVSNMTDKVRRTFDACVRLVMNCC